MLVAAVVLGEGWWRHVLARCGRVFSVAFVVVLFFPVVVPFHLQWLGLAFYPVLVFAAPLPGCGAISSFPASLPPPVFLTSFWWGWSGFPSRAPGPILTPPFVAPWATTAVSLVSGSRAPLVVTSGTVGVTPRPWLLWRSVFRTGPFPPRSWVWKGAWPWAWPAWPSGPTGGTLLCFCWFYGSSDGRLGLPHPLHHTF